MRIHLDLVGGMAGDMFIAALLDAVPDHAPGMLETIDAALGPSKVVCKQMPYNDSILQGRRFVVLPVDRFDDHGHGHVHSHWRDIRRQLKEALPHAIGHHAIGIFTLLADAEARVHGVSQDDVSFHEVGAWDSIADIVGAAYLIERLQASWSCGPVPLGGGRIRTAHGLMPVPAPATTLLLEGFELFDDGIDGERVTPTGAAILRYLCKNVSKPARSHECMIASGTGFGTRVLDGVSNCLRVLVMEKSQRETASATMGNHRQLAVIEFEVDDQSAEDLAMGLTHLRAHEAIFDVVQAPVFGKKGRMATSVRVLAAPDSIDAALEACFRETTTIGLRYHFVHGAALPRRVSTVQVDGLPIRVKAVERPGGASAKAESDDVIERQDQTHRVGLRTRAERLALDAMEAQRNHAEDA